MRGKVLFGSVAIALSVGLFGLVYWARDLVPVLASYIGGLLIPAAAIMIAAIGFGWRRKLTFVASLVGGLLLVEWASDATGLTAFLARAIDPRQEPLTFVVSMVYASVVYVFPLVMLVLFVGRQPSRLWDRQAPSPSPAPSGRDEDERLPAPEGPASA